MRLSGHFQAPSIVYSGIRARRIQQLKSICKLVPDAPFGSDAFLKLVSDDGLWNLLCHHAANVTNYKSADFDIHHAAQANTAVS